jgi:uncharacterized membrane protein YeaQ/YmgE (transglycosylase-associated protein family)
MSILKPLFDGFCLLSEGFAFSGDGDHGVMSIGEIIGLIIVGLVIGALGRLINPGRDPMGIIATIVIGVASALIVGWLVGGGILGFILAVIVAVILVSVYARFVGPRRTTAVTRL